MRSSTLLAAGHVFIAVSLDGYIARPDGDIDWLMDVPDAGEDHGYDAFVDTVDGHVIGRHTYQKVLTFGDWHYKKPVIVPTRALTNADLPDHLAGRVTFTAEEPEQLMRRLASEGWRHAYVDGGQLIQSFLRAGLIHEIQITHVPILLGSGIPLFGALDRDVKLRHLETKAYPSGLVDSKYEVLR